MDKASFRDKLLREISPFDLERIKKIMLDNGRSSCTVEYMLSVVRNSFNRVRDWGKFTGENPVSKVRKLKINNCS